MSEVACEYPEGAIFFETRPSRRVSGDKDHFRILNFGWKSTWTWFFPRLGYVWALTSNKGSAVCDFGGAMVHAWLLAWGGMFGRILRCSIFGVEKTVSFLLSGVYALGNFGG